MRVLVTGDRNWRNARALRDALYIVLADLYQEYGPRTKFTLVHGDARGADTTADIVWQLRYPGLPIERYPADWSTGRGAGPRRNQAMLESGIDYVIGFNNDIVSSRGTRDMLQRCARAGIPGRLFTETEEVKDWQTLVV